MHDEIDRFFVEIGKRIPVDQYGLFSQALGRSKNLKDKGALLSYDRCCIIGESGIGKTEFVRGIIDTDPTIKLFPAVDYDGNTLVSAVRNACSSRKVKCSTIILDGIDELITPLPQIAELINEYKHRHFLLTSTDCRSVEYIASLVPGFMRMTMAPLSISDVQKMAEARLGADSGMHFMEEVEAKNLLSTCRTPLGVKILCGYWAEKGRLHQSRCELIRRFVTDLCERNRNGKLISRNGDLSKEAFINASKIAGAMLLTGGRRIVRERTSTDGMCLALRDVFVDDKILAAELLSRAVFKSSVDGGYSFAHKSYFNILAAEWVRNDVQEKKQSTLFIDDTNTFVYPQNSEVAGIVALGNTSLFCTLNKIAPECLAPYAADMQDSQKADVLPAFINKAGKKNSLCVYAPIRAADFLCKRNKAYICKMIKRYSSLSAKSLHIVLSVYRHFNLVSESETLATIALDRKVSFENRLRAMSAISEIPVCNVKLRERFLGALTVREYDDDEKELEFKACLVRTQIRIGFRIDDVLPGIESFSRIDTRQMMHRHIRMLRAEFPKVFDDAGITGTSACALLSFSLRCLASVDTNYYVRVMATFAFQFCVLRSMDFGLVESVAEVYVKLVSCGVDPLKTLNRESDKSVYLSKEKLLREEAIRRKLVTTIVTKEDICSNQSLQLIFSRSPLLSAKDENWLIENQASASVENRKRRWRILHDQLIEQRVKRESRLTSARRRRETALYSNAISKDLLRNKSSNFQSVFDEIVGTVTHDINFQVERFHVILSRCESGVIDKICVLAKRYLRKSLGRWKGGSHSGYVLAAVLMLLRHEDGFLRELSNDNLSCLAHFVMNDALLWHFSYFSPMMVEYGTRFGVRIVDDLYSKWKPERSEEQLGFIRTIGSYMSHTAVSTFRQRVTRKVYSDEFVDAMIRALLEISLRGQTIYLDMFTDYIASKVKDGKGNLIRGRSFYLYCLLQTNPLTTVEKIQRQDEVDAYFSSDFVKELNGRPLFHQHALDKLDCRGLQVAYEFLVKIRESSEIDRRNILSRLISLDDDASYFAIVQLSGKFSGFEELERFHAVAEMQRCIRLFKCVPNVEVMDMMKSLMSNKDTPLWIKIKENPIEKLIWAVASSIVLAIVTFGVNKMLGHKTNAPDMSEDSMDASLQVDQSSSVRQTQRIDNSQQINFNGATINAPITIKANRE